jgi:hypothetical protein
MLAGFVLAHATWSVSDLPKGDLLVPMAIYEKSGQRQLERFSALTQEQAITAGKDAMKAHDQDVDAWAFSREGQFLESGKYVSVVTVEAKTKDMPTSIVFVQKFQPYATGHFQLIGAPTVSIGGIQVSDPDAKKYILQLMAGIRSHPKAAENWDNWTK